jgi:hypothetical protein
MSYKQQKNLTVTIIIYNYNIICFIYYNYITQQERHCTYKATSWRVRATIVAVEKQ